METITDLDLIFLSLKGMLETYRPPLVAKVEDDIRDEINLFEQHGWNYAAWQWQPAWEPLTWGDMSFNFRFGPDPENVAEVENDQITTYLEAWSRNLVRPSTFGD